MLDLKGVRDGTIDKPSPHDTKNAMDHGKRDAHGGRVTLCASRLAFYPHIVHRSSS